MDHGRIPQLSQHVHKHTYKKSTRSLHTQHSVADNKGTRAFHSSKPTVLTTFTYLHARTCRPARSKASRAMAPDRLHVSLTKPNTARCVTLRLMRSLSAMHASCATNSSPSGQRSFFSMCPFPTPVRGCDTLSRSQFARSSFLYGRQSASSSCTRRSVQPAYSVLHQREHVPRQQIRHCQLTPAIAHARFVCRAERQSLI